MPLSPPRLREGGPPYPDGGLEGGFDANKGGTWTKESWKAAKEEMDRNNPPRDDLILPYKLPGILDHISGNPTSPVSNLLLLLICYGNPTSPALSAKLAKNRQFPPKFSEDTWRFALR